MALLACTVLVLVGLLVTAIAIRGLIARRHDLALGSLVAIDAGAPVTLRSDRYRLSGRPDVLRRLPDGRWEIGRAHV
jgi:hypothetical protein